MHSGRLWPKRELRVASSSEIISMKDQSELRLFAAPGDVIEIEKKERKKERESKKREKEIEIRYPSRGSGTCSSFLGLSTESLRQQVSLSR